MLPRQNGDWVRYEDYCTLEAEKEDLEKKIAKAEEALR